MDETIKIYRTKDENSRIENVKKSLPIYSEEVKKTDIRKMPSRFQSMRETVQEYENKLKNVMFRHPGFNLMYNWLIVMIVLAIVVECIIWGLDIRTSRMAEALTVQAMADYQAEQDAIETARQEKLRQEYASEEAVMKRESESIATLLYGIRNFEEKYHYSDKDFMTYARVVFNRVESKQYGNTIEEVVKQPDQWVGYYDSNPVLDRYYKIAYKAVEEWHHETTKPVSNDYVYAELTPNGIWLKNDIHADGYARRWQYGT